MFLDEIIPSLLIWRMIGDHASHILHRKATSRLVVEMITYAHGILETTVLPTSGN